MLSAFAIHRPATVAEASALMQEHERNAAFYAGGTELLVLMKERLVHFDHLIDIKHIPGLAGISLDDAAGSISIGPMASHRAIETSSVILERAPLLAEVEAQVANIRVRNAGTIGGNLCFAEPHSDPATLLVAWDAHLTLTSSSGSRTIAGSDFFIGLLETAREPDELLTDIAIPVLPAQAGSSYQRFKTHERPTATAAATLWIDEGEIRDARVVAGSVGAGPERLTAVESALKGQRPGTELFAAASESAAVAVSVEEEGFESSDYKRHLIGVLMAKALRQAAERATS
ncbi:MAG: xanthine dehydrogenase family protein subunit M [Thermomicrobiales bacterium]